MGIKKYEFGSCVVTSVGSLGLENCLVPIPRILYISYFLLFIIYYSSDPYTYDY